MKNHSVKNFVSGLISSIESSSIPDGAASSNRNWIVQGDKYELRRGQEQQDEADSGAGKSRVYIAEYEGNQQRFKVAGKKVFYYASGDWNEIGTDILTSDGDGLDVTFAEYHGLAGHQVWIGSPYVLLKIMTANPASYTDMYASGTNFKGYIKIKWNRMFLWGRIKDNSGLRGSHIDTLNYTTVTDEVIGTGDSSEKTFTGTLAFKAGGAKRTCFAISVNDVSVVETFTDNFDGTLTGDQGGTGTINYTSGAISVTFNTAPGVEAVHVDYQWEDTNDNGISDFRETGTRVASEGFYFPQGSGEELMNIEIYKDIIYCLHRRSIWTLELTINDTNAKNNVFRDNIGIPNLRASVATGDGIYILDDADENDPKIRILTYAEGSTEVIPPSISDGLNLTDYRFDFGCGFQFGEWILFAIRHKDHAYNDTVLLYHRAGIAKGAWDKLDYTALNFGIYDGACYAGDSITKNSYTLFSGTDDDDSKIINHITFNLTDLQIQGLKKLKQFIVEGAIGPQQNITISLAFDDSPFVEIGNIEGSGSYVDSGQAINVGALVLGRDTVGGSGTGISAYHYLRKIKLTQDKFRRVQVKFEATEIGWADVSMFDYKDIRIKSQKLPSKYR